jgi:hypothetical protein
VPASTVNEKFDRTGLFWRSGYENATYSSGENWKQIKNDSKTTEKQKKMKKKK